MKLDYLEVLLREKYPEMIIDQLLKNYKKRTNQDKKQLIKEVLYKANEHDLKLSNILMFGGETIQLEDFEEKYVNLEQKKYPERNLKRKHYDEDYASNGDEILHCDDCDEDYEGICHIHGPMLWICDKKVPKKTPDRAIKTLPAILSIGKSSMPDAGFGVWTEVFLPKGLVFGPYKGSILKDSKEAEKSGYAWKIWDGKKVHHYVEAVEKDVANWLRFVNCADSEERQNLFAFQFEKKIFYKTYKPILPSSELLVWYGDEYGEDLGFIKKPTFQSKNSDARSSSRHSYNTRRKEFKSLKGLDKHLEPSNKNASLKFTRDCIEHTTSRMIKNTKRSRESELESTHNSTHSTIKKNRASSFRNKGKQALKNNFPIEELVEKTLKVLCLHRRDNNSTSINNIFSSIKFPQNEKPFKCPHCENAFRVNSHLEKHVSLKHNLNFPHMCPICFRGFVSEQILNDHAELIHKTELQGIIQELLLDLKK